MPEPRQLRNAPITEALFDFRIEPPTKLSADAVAFVQERLRANYPKAEQPRKFETRLRVEHGKLLPPETADLGMQGLFLKTEDERTVAQFRADGLTLNRLKPYSSWRELFPESMRLWSLYCEATGATVASRLGLRYINHLAVPMRQGDQLSEYFLAEPTVPEPVPQVVSGFQTRVNLRDPASDVRVNLAQAFGGTAPADATLLLDIDVFKVGPVASDDQDGITSVFESLHEMKNRVFFSLVTERCLQLFQ